MNSIDRDLQQRVWNRVTAGREPLSPEGLLLEERLIGALSRKLGHKQLALHSDHRASAVQGICRLSGISDACLRPAVPRSNDPERFLFGSLLRQRQHFCELREDPEYGCLYDALAQSVQTDLLLLARHIGA